MLKSLLIASPAESKLILLSLTAQRDGQQRLTCALESKNISAIVPHGLPPGPMAISNEHVYIGVKPDSPTGSGYVFAYKRHGSSQDGLEVKLSYAFELVVPGSPTNIGISGSRVAVALYHEGEFVFFETSSLEEKTGSTGTPQPCSHTGCTVSHRPVQPIDKICGFPGAHSCAVLPNKSFLCGALKNNSVVYVPHAPPADGRGDQSHHDNFHEYKTTAPNSGPRHIALHPRWPDRAFVINELSGTVTIWSFEPGQEKWSSTFTSGEHKPQAWAADIHFSASGDYLFASERSDSTLTKYKVCGGDTLETLVTWPVGKCPRGFNILASDDVELLVCTGQEVSAVSVYDITQGGATTAPPKIMEHEVGKGFMWVLPLC